MFETGCLNCSNKIIKEYHLCENCLSNLRLDVNWGRDLNYLDDVVIGGEYVGLLKNIILDYKFNDKVYFSEVISDILLEKLFAAKLHLNYQYITYVPMYKTDLSERGYNQSKILAEKIAKKSLLNYVDIIKKVKRTQRQVEVLNIKRYTNLKNAFEISGRVAENIIVVDDVITTGSTLEEIAKLLKENGAKKVAALVATTHNL